MEEKGGGVISSRAKTWGNRLEGMGESMLFEMGDEAYGERRKKGRKVRFWRSALKKGSERTLYEFSKKQSESGKGYVKGFPGSEKQAKDSIGG